MKTINPYLNFNGNAEEAFNFYKSIFGGEFLTIMRYKDIPDTERVPENDKDKIMHIGLPIGNGIILMGTDLLESLGQHLSVGNNYHFSISAESKEEADKLYNALSNGGKIKMPIADTFWGDYFGMFTDKFGVQWMVNFDNKEKK